jgi:VWFA-related protein
MPYGLRQLAGMPIIPSMVRTLLLGPCIAAIAISLACLSSSAQANPTTLPQPFYFPPVPQQPNHPAPRRSPEPDKGSINPKNSIVLQPDPNSGLLKMDVVVTDQQGKSVAGLGEKDLTLLDNGQPRKIVTFRAFDDATKPDPPVEIILVVDEIDTPAVLLNALEQTAQKVLLQSGGHLTHPVKVYRISNEGLFASEATSYDGNGLLKQIQERKEPRTIWRTADIAGSFQWDPYGSTPITRRAFFDVSWAELPHSLIALGSIAIEERRTPGRKLLFWVGNSWPIKPSRWQHLFDTVTELSTRLREARIAIWSGNLQPGQQTFAYQNFLAGVTSEKTLSVENVALQVFAVQSGGGELSGIGDVGDLISHKVAQANTFYTITFDPQRTNEVDEYHDLKVETGNPGLTAHTRTGYYDEPVYYDQARADAKDVTVAQVRDLMNELQHTSDSEAEQQLNGMELTERLSSSDLEKWLALLKDKKKTRQALTALADQSVFLPPPAEDVMDQAPPGIADQRQMIQRTVNYVSKTIPILPNLTTERTTTLYLEPPRAQGQTWKTATGNHSLDPVSIAKSAVNLSNGNEAVQAISFSPLRKTEEDRSLETKGAFGPILASVLIAVAKPESKLQWARWEAGDNGPLAVFRYNIPKGTPIFHVGYCCMAVDFDRASFETDAPTLGEIAVDPASGAIMRLTIRADLSYRLPLQHSDLMIEYGSVMLGGISYICPIRSVSISRQRSVVELSEYGEKFKVYAPFETILNDVTYENYHLFRSSSRVVPGFTESPDNK